MRMKNMRQEEFRSLPEIPFQMLRTGQFTNDTRKLHVVIHSVVVSEPILFLYQYSFRRMKKRIDKHYPFNHNADHVLNIWFCFPLAVNNDSPCSTHIHIFLKRICVELCISS